MEKCLVVNTKKTQIICFNSRSCNLPSFFYDGSLLSYTDQFKYLGMVCNRYFNLHTAADAALQPFTKGIFKVQQFAQEHNLYNRLHAIIWLLKTYAIPAGMYASQIWATPFLRQGREMDNPLQKWLLTTLKRWLGVRETTPSWSILRECGLEPLQFNWFRAAIRLYNSFTQCNSLSVRKILQADACLSHLSSDCWCAQLLSAFDGLQNSGLFKQKLLACDLIDLKLLAVDLRSRHAQYWTQFSTSDPRTQNSKQLTYHQWCALPLRRITANRAPYQTPKYFHLDLPIDVLRNVARFRLRVHTLRCETITWSRSSFPYCDLCRDDDSIQDEKHVIFYCANPHVISLRGKYASLYLNNEAQDIQKFLHQNNNKLFFFLHELISFYEQASSRMF